MQTEKRPPRLAASFFYAMTVCLSHLPIGAHHGVAGAEQFLAPKLIAELEWDFFKLLRWSFLKQRSLPKRFEFFRTPFRLARLDNESSNVWLYQP
jgi:hypothetical protein